MIGPLKLGLRRVAFAVALLVTCMCYTGPAAAQQGCLSAGSGGPCTNNSTASPDCTSRSGTCVIDPDNSAACLCAVQNSLLCAGSGASCAEAVPQHFCAQIGGRCTSSGGASPSCVCFTASGGLGDPHYRKWGGLLFHYQGIGEYVLAEASAGFAVQARTVRWGGSAASVMRTIALRVGHDRVVVEVADGAHLRLNGELIELPCDGNRTTSTPKNANAAVQVNSTTSSCDRRLSLAGGGSIEVADSSVEVVWPGGLSRATIHVRRGYLDLELVHAPGQGLASGLLGIQGLPDQQFVTRAGRVYPSPLSLAELNDFGDSYRVREEESLFAYLPGERAADFQRGTASSGPLEASDLDLVTAAAAEQRCVAAGVTNVYLLNACMVDVSVMGVDAFPESFLGEAATDEMLLRRDAAPDAGHSSLTRGPGCGCAIETPSPAAYGMRGWLLLLGLALVRRGRARRDSRAGSEPSSAHGGRVPRHRPEARGHRRNEPHGDWASPSARTS